MRIIKTSGYAEMSGVAARLIAAQVLLKPDSVVGLATGDSPIGLYGRLAEWHTAGDADFSEMVAVNLDEYRGIAPGSPQSYRYFMEKHLFSKINAKPGNVHIPDGLAPDPDAECARYDAVISGCGGIDLQLLGIGHNGHIGFNEPGGCFVPGTHLVALSEDTKQANSRFFDSPGDVPSEAYTVGIKAIMQARKILMVASGAGKAEAVRRAFCCGVTPSVPASVLQLHGDVTLVGDEAALSFL